MFTSYVVNNKDNHNIEVITQFHENRLKSDQINANTSGMTKFTHVLNVTSIDRDIRGMKTLSLSRPIDVEGVETFAYKTPIVVGGKANEMMDTYAKLLDTKDIEHPNNHVILNVTYSHISLSLGLLVKESTHTTTKVSTLRRSLLL